jgi:hypothetical protein
MTLKERFLTTPSGDRANFADINNQRSVKLRMK